MLPSSNRLILLIGPSCVRQRRGSDHRKIYSRNFLEEVLVEAAAGKAGHREGGWEVTEDPNRLQFTQGHGGEAGVDLKGEGVGSAGLAVGQPRERLAVAEQKFDLEAGRVIAVEGDGVEVQRGAEQEGDPHTRQLNG